MPPPYANPKASSPPRQVAFDPNLARDVACLLAQGLNVQAIAFQLRGRADDAIIGAYARDAQNNPFFQGAAQLAAPLAKRSWILSAQHKAWKMQPNGTAVPRRAALAPDDFLADYYANQRPVILEGLVDDWPALSLWDASYLEAKIGRNTVIEAQVGRDTRTNFEAEKTALTQTITFGKVADHLRKNKASNNIYVTANNGASNRSAFDPVWQDFGPIDGYTTKDDSNDGFLWIGPKGTITPFHHDLTNNLLIQVKGRKKVVMAPNWDEAWMKSDNRFFSALTPRDAKKLTHGPTLVECTIGPGDALFIPVGWWHHITSLEESYTVLFTNFVWPNNFTDGFPA